VRLTPDGAAERPWDIAETVSSEGHGGAEPHRREAHRLPIPSKLIRKLARIVGMPRAVSVAPGITQRMSTGVRLRLPDNFHRAVKTSKSGSGPHLGFPAASCGPVGSGSRIKGGA
jgi:hypothetical protein